MTGLFIIIGCAVGIGIVWSMYSVWKKHIKGGKLNTEEPERTLSVRSESGVCEYEVPSKTHGFFPPDMYVPSSLEDITPHPSGRRPYLSAANSLQRPYMAQTAGSLPGPIDGSQHEIDPYAMITQRSSTLINANNGTGNHVIVPGILPLGSPSPLGAYPRVDSPGSVAHQSGEYGKDSSVGRGAATSSVQALPRAANGSIPGFRKPSADSRPASAAVERPRLNPSSSLKRRAMRQLRVASESGTHNPHRRPMSPYFPMPPSPFSDVTRGKDFHDPSALSPTKQTDTEHNNNTFCTWQGTQPEQPVSSSLDQDLSSLNTPQIP
eukprot:gene27424-4720_t